MTFCWQRLVKERNLSFAIQFQSCPNENDRQNFTFTLGGGQLSFIGRTLFRNPEESAIHILVNASYLDSTFKEFGISKVQMQHPTLLNTWKQRFRRAVGKIMWMCQSRHDLVTVRNSTAVTVSGNGSSTSRSFEILRNDMNVTLRLPSESSDALTAEGYSPSSLMVHSFSDASHGPWRFHSMSEAGL